MFRTEVHKRAVVKVDFVEGGDNRFGSRCTVDTAIGYEVLVREHDEGVASAKKMLEANFNICFVHYRVSKNFCKHK